MSTPGTPRKRRAHTEDDENNSQDMEEIDRPGNTLQNSPFNPRRRVQRKSESRERSVTPSFGPTLADDEVVPRTTRSGQRYDPDANQDRATGLRRDSSPQPGPSSRNQRSSSLVPPPTGSQQAPQQSHFAFITGNPYIKSIIIVLLLLAVMGISAFFRSENLISDNKSIVSNPWKEKRMQLRTIFMELEGKQFVSQQPDTFIQINALLDSSLRKQEQNQPSAIAVLVPPDMNVNSFPRCFIRKIGNVINRVFEPDHLIPLKELNLNTFSETQNITFVHDDIKAYFDRGGKAVVVEDVEKLEQEAHLFVFHAFCDNSRAYQKRAIFFFIIPVPQNIYERYDWNFRSGGQISYAVLDEAWVKVLSPDKRPALIARVAAATVLLNNGDTC